MAKAIARWVVPTITYVAYVYVYVDVVRPHTYYAHMGYYPRMSMDALSMLVCMLITHVHMRLMRREITHYYRRQYMR